MSTYEEFLCPHCGQIIRRFKNPLPTVDIIIELQQADGNQGIVLIERKNYPLGWAIPGGFVDYGESCEQAAVREAREETSLEVKLSQLLGVYSEPDRDPRHHTVSVVYIAQTEGEPQARDDAKNLGIFTAENLPSPLAFDHARILQDYFRRKNGPKNC